MGSPLHCRGNPAGRRGLTPSLTTSRGGSVLLTSTDNIRTTEEAPSTAVALAPPNAGQRRALLAAYGAERPDDHSEAFTTPYELSIAAECARDIGPDASRTELFRAYLRRRCPSIASRAVLRRLARELDRTMSASLPLDTAISQLERSTDPPFQADTLDEALSSPLLMCTQGRLWFRHELLGRFCAAEDLVARAASGEELVEFFTDPRHQDLVDFACDLEVEPARRTALLAGLGDPRRLRTGLLGHLGPEVQHRLHRDVRAAFAAAHAATAAASLDLVGDEPPFDLTWNVSAPLPLDHERLLTAAAPCVEHSMFIDEVAALLEATDKRGDAAIDDLHALGDSAPITSYVSATYGLGNSLHQAPLPATTIAKALEHRHVWRRHDPDGRGGAASALWRSGHRRGWGLLYAALALVDPAEPADQALFPDLLDMAWRARGYHLQLQALIAAQEMSSGLEGTEHFRRVRDYLLSIPPPSHWGLSSTLVDTLTSYDAIECGVTLDALRENIREILRTPAEPNIDVDEAAFHVFSSQFENESIVGPYSEAIAELTPAERTQLWVRATRGRSPYSMFVDTLLRDMVEHATVGDEQVLVTLHREADHLDLTAGGAQNRIASHFTAVRLLARFTNRLHDVADSEVPRVWRLVGQLLFAAARPHHAPELEPAIDTEQTWTDLLTHHRSEALDVLLNLRRGQVFQPDRERPWLSELMIGHADHLRRFLTWALEHPDELVTVTIHPIDRQAQLRLAFALLGNIGDNRTASVLEPWVNDPALGGYAVDAIRKLRGATGLDGESIDARY